MTSSTKARQPRLRASCDGCFVAKVKCSKARPICSRCLACGTECRYSPSSRAGKPKSDGNGNNHTIASRDSADTHSLQDDKNIIFNQPLSQPPDHIFTGWTTPPTSVDGNMSRNSSISTGLTLLGVDEHPLADPEPLSAPPDVFSSGMPWTPPTDMSCAPYDMSVSASQIPGTHVRSQSLDMSMGTHMPWPEPGAHELMNYQHIHTPTSMTSTYFPSPTTPPSGGRPGHTRHKSSPSVTINGGSCTCFTVCLQSLQALHNASSPDIPPFDLVLSLNRKAVEGCAAMLACPKCMSRSGTHTAAMLLATVMGKITSFYKNATHIHFENGAFALNQSSPTTNLGVSFGIYQLNSEDGRWLELEILARELRKLEELYARLREVFPELSDDAEVSKAMIGYLGSNLVSTLEVVGHRKVDTVFA